MKTAQPVTTLTRDGYCYNPYFLEGKQVERILFFNTDGVQFEVNWFGSNNEHPSLEIPSEVPRKLKLKFDSPTAYYMKSTGEYVLPNEKRIDVYVPLSLIEHDIKRKVKHRETEESITYRDELTVVMNASSYTYTKNPEGSRLEYTTHTTKIAAQTLKTGSRHTTELKPKGQQLENWSAKAKTLGVELRPSQFKQLEKLFTISLK